MSCKINGRIRSCRCRICHNQSKSTISVKSENFFTEPKPIFVYFGDGNVWA